MKKTSKLRQEREARIKERVEKIKRWEAYEYLKTHLSFAENYKEKEKRIISNRLDDFEAILLEIKTLIKHFKNFVPDVSEQNKITAIYLLITKSYFDLEALTHLVKEGFNFQVIEITRSAIESIDLVFLFIDESSDRNLEKWFKGEIITNDISRKSADRVINSGIFGNTKMPVYELKRDIYDIYSEYTHTGYCAVLDLIDPYHKDLDFYRLTGYHFSLKYFDITILNLGFNILLALKFVFIYLSDEERIKEIDKLLLQFVGLKATHEEIPEILKNYI